MQILLGTADGESIVIRDCTFGAGTGTAGSRRSTATVGGGEDARFSPVIACYWFGDASAPTRGRRRHRPEQRLHPTVRGRRFASTQGAHLRLQRHGLVEANSFENGTVYVTSRTDLLNVVAIANHYSGVSRLFDPASVPVGSPPTYVPLGNQGADDVLSDDTRLSGGGTFRRNNGRRRQSAEGIGVIA